MRSVTPPTKEQATGTRHLCSCCTSCCTSLCFSPRKKAYLIKVAGPQVGVCQSMDLPTDSVQKHGTLCTQLSPINAGPASFHSTAVAGTAKQQFVAFVFVYMLHPYNLAKMSSWNIVRLWENTLCSDWTTLLREVIIQSSVLKPML